MAAIGRVPQPDPEAESGKPLAERRQFFNGKNVSPFRDWYKRMTGLADWDEEKIIKKIEFYSSNEVVHRIKGIPEFGAAQQVPDGVGGQRLQTPAERLEAFWEKFQAAFVKADFSWNAVKDISYIEGEAGEELVFRFEEGLKKVAPEMVYEASKVHYLLSTLRAHKEVAVAVERNKPAAGWTYLAARDAVIQEVDFVKDALDRISRPDTKTQKELGSREPGSNSREGLSGLGTAFSGPVKDPIEELTRQMAELTIHLARLEQANLNAGSSTRPVVTGMRSGPSGSGTERMQRCIYCLSPEHKKRQCPYLTQHMNEGKIVVGENGFIYFPGNNSGTVGEMIAPKWDGGGMKETVEKFYAPSTSVSTVEVMGEIPSRQMMVNVNPKQVQKKGKSTEKPKTPYTRPVTKSAGPGSERFSEGQSSTSQPGSSSRSPGQRSLTSIPTNDPSIAIQIPVEEIGQRPQVVQFSQEVPTSIPVRRENEPFQDADTQTKGRSEPAFRLEAEVEKGKSPENVVDTIMDTQVQVSIGDLMAAAPKVRELVRQQLVRKRIPLLGGETEGEEESEMEIETERVESSRETEIGKRLLRGGIQVAAIRLGTQEPVTVSMEDIGSGEFFLAHSSVSALDHSLGQDWVAAKEKVSHLEKYKGAYAAPCVYLPVQVGLDYFPVRGLVDGGSEIDLISSYTAKHAGLLVDTTPNLIMKSANATRDRLIGVCHDVKVEVGGILRLLQLWVVEADETMLLLGRPWARTVFCKVEDRENGETWVSFREDRHGVGKSVQFMATGRNHPRLIEQWPPGTRNRHPHKEEEELLSQKCFPTRL